MRGRIAPVAISLLLLLVAAPGFAQDAATPANGNAPMAGPMAPAAPATPSATNSTPAAASVVCEYKEHQGQVVPLRQCVSQNEATRRRIQQQESIREFQMQGLIQQNH